MQPNKTQVQTLRLALQIADETARADIEMQCRCLTGEGREAGTVEEIQSAWYDCGSADMDSITLILKALYYLTLRGRVIYHPSMTNWVRFIRESRCDRSLEAMLDAMHAAASGSER